MSIGVGVEGPSDRTFWDKVLHKHFRGVHFDVRNMKNRCQLIRETPRLLETFRGAHYAAGFVLLDRDDTPCATAVINEFDPHIQSEARRPLDQRYLFICVAIRELEAWFLADAQAITSILPAVQYTPPQETAVLNAEVTLKGLWRQHHGNAAFNKIDFAGRMAPQFSPMAAQQRSSSFAHFWTRITKTIRS